MPFVKQEFLAQTPTKAHRFVQSALQISAREAQKVIDKGRVCVNGEVFLEKAGLINGRVEISRFVARDLGLKSFFVTQDFIAFEKPAKLLTHPKGRFSHESLLDCIKFYSASANPAHRLDFETSGIVLASLNRRAEVELKRMFERREISKTYQARVFGRLHDMTIDLPLLEQNKKSDLGVRSIVSKHGKHALTRVQSVFYDEARDITYALIFPLTGRTHQIRAHLAHIGHRILGECLYGVSDQLARKYLERGFGSDEREELFGAPRLNLHAHRLIFAHEGRDFDLKSNAEFWDL